MATKSKVAHTKRAPKKRGISPAPHGGAQGKQPVSEGIRRAAKRAGLSPRTRKIAAKFEKLRAEAKAVVARHATPPVTESEKAAVQSAKEAEELRAIEKACESTDRKVREAAWRRMRVLRTKVEFHTFAALRGTPGADRKPYYSPTPGDAIRIALHGHDGTHPSRIAEGTCAALANDAQLLVPAIDALIERTRNCVELGIKDDGKLRSAIRESLQAMATRARLVGEVFSDVEAANVQVFTAEEIAKIETEGAR
ncbi:MAG: hypothetical protein WDO74_22225 [Pseudomonadota bacterium]